MFRLIWIHFFVGSFWFGITMVAAFPTAFQMAGPLHADPVDEALMHAASADSVLLPSFLPDTIWVSTKEPDFAFILAEDSLRMMAADMIRSSEDSVRLVSNARFMACLKEVIGREGSMAYAFDSLSTVSFLVPADSSFRIITWYVPLSGQQFRYFGFVQLSDVSAHLADSDQEVPSHEKYQLIELKEVIGYQGDETAGLFSDKSWYGSWYYELISNRHEHNHHYVLLGWRGDNPATRKRIIEPLLFDEGRPVFGAAVFNMRERPPQMGRYQPESLSEHDEPLRMVFEYSVRTSMSLLYDNQMIRQGEERIPMIVFDRLEPLEERFRGQRGYYVPEGNIFDAFVFRDGRWVLIRDVDARRN
jgi:hypothetical protein